MTETEFGFNFNPNSVSVTQFLPKDPTYRLCSLSGTGFVSVLKEQYPALWEVQQTCS